MKSGIGLFSALAIFVVSATSNRASAAFVNAPAHQKTSIRAGVVPRFLHPSQAAALEEAAAFEYKKEDEEDVYHPAPLAAVVHQHHDDLEASTHRSTSSTAATARMIQKDEPKRAPFTFARSLVSRMFSNPPVNKN
mmetsp:Transcript_17440/g.31472  ORF Transcript_17440/g.31472 Transcript_17440/m.31472 type:complete len:136 (-) Transcript_17440:356-763(-)|eukprot:CAMPEP_0198286942 /NCGR_PEP_ID=MMETSP1449-20131203/5893_1 /TAXON_ID=420275 /ORGANISM="Attheya septentrionalis, Strain CCMP2084" /LENGTH=135 /DNA_ID=CAMNT_0043984807 /DNA_START=122 /DNA_END=529 /DNA_ORIENTATION=-